jgi:HTH-type transcriptional regulator/antitoxin HigA
MRFFRTNDLSDVPCLAHNARKTDYGETTPLQWAWLFRVRQIASEMVVPNYSAKALQKAVDGMTSLTLDPEEVRHVPRLLAECGVRFVVVETLPKANIDGVCFWLDGVSPVVGITTRFDRIDNFWFVVRHELDHLLNEDSKQATLSADIVDVDIEKMDASDDTLPVEEVRANAVAATFCVPKDELESFFIRKYPYISERDMLGFARRIQRHPGIVVGQLQRRMKRYDWLPKHKVKVRSYLVGSAVMDGWGVPAPVEL